MHVSRTAGDLGHQILVDPQQWDAFKAEIEEAGYVRGREYQVYHKDGSKFWVAGDARAVRDENAGIT